MMGSIYSHLRQCDELKHKELEESKEGEIYRFLNIHRLKYTHNNIYFSLKKKNKHKTLVTSWMVSIGGGGSLWRHKLTITQVTFLKNVIGIDGLMKESKGFTTPRLMT